jgi:hypothetical protein
VHSHSSEATALACTYTPGSRTNLYNLQFKISKFASFARSTTGQRPALVLFKLFQAMGWLLGITTVLFFPANALWRIFSKWKNAQKIGSGSVFMYIKGANVLKSRSKMSNVKILKK